MILVDTSVWIDHLHRTNDELVGLLHHGEVMTHPMVISEVALGSIRDRATVLTLLDALESAVVAKSDEVLAMVSAHRPHGRGLSLVDAHLLASAHLPANCRIRTRNKQLASAAAMASLGWNPTQGVASGGATANPAWSSD